MSLKDIRIVLVRPMYGGNIGSVCRAMKNMGLSRLYLVAPETSVDWDEARKMAVNADDVLERKTVCETLDEAVSDCGAVTATTNRAGLYRLHSRTPREWAPEFVERSGQGPAAVLFGPEDSGLTNEDIALCNLIVRIPTSPRYPSLNLSQAVMVCCYELFLAGGTYHPPQEKHPEAPVELRERMYTMWDEMLSDIGFHDEQKAGHMMMAFRRIFSRGTLSTADVNILMGVARQALWAAGQSRDPAAEKEPESPR